MSIIMDAVPYSNADELDNFLEWGGQYRIVVEKIEPLAEEPQAEPQAEPRQVYASVADYFSAIVTGAEPLRHF